MGLPTCALLLKLVGCNGKTHLAFISNYVDANIQLDDASSCSMKSTYSLSVHLAVLVLLITRTLKVFPSRYPLGRHISHFDTPLSHRQGPWQMCLTAKVRIFICQYSPILPPSRLCPRLLRVLRQRGTFRGAGLPENDGTTALRRWMILSLQTNCVLMLGVLTGTFAPVLCRLC